jgi:hypothetical protein
MIWLRDIFVWFIVIGAVIAIIKLLLPLVFAQWGGGGTLAQIINIVLWAFVAIMIVYIAFALISCLLGSGGSFPSLSPRR